MEQFHIKGESKNGKKMVAQIGDVSNLPQKLF